MENIILPTVASPPQARAPDPGASGGTEGAGGIFGMLLSAQLAKGDSPNGIGKKAAEKNAYIGSALLISALVQGSIFSQGNIEQPGTNENGQQSPAATAASPAAGTNALAALMELLKAKGQDGLKQFADANPQFASALNALLGQSGGQESLQGLPAGQKGEALQTLLAALAPEEAQEQNAAETASPQTGTQALEEIRQMFAALIAEAPEGSSPRDAGTAQGASAVPAALQPAENEQTAVPSGNAAQVLSPEASVLPSALSAQGGSEQAPADGGQPKLAAQAEGVNAASLKPAEAQQKKETVDFGFVLKAGQGQETSAASQGAKAGAPAAEVPRQAFDSIVEKITSMQTASQNEMEISLKPDFLGKVVIRLSMDDAGGLVAKIAASNPKVQDAFLAQANALQNALSGQGLKDVRVVVTSSSVPDAALQQQADRRGQDRGDRNRKNAVIVDAAETADAASPISAYEQVYRTGSVNCLA